MLQLNVQSDISQVTRFLTDLQRKHVPAATVVALNRVAGTVRKLAVDRIRERLAIKAAVARGSIVIARAGVRRLSVSIEAAGRPLPLRDYGAKQTKKGATYRVSKAGGRKLYTREGRPGFILAQRGGHVFVRTEDDPPGKRKGKIKKVYGPSLPQYFTTKVIRKAMDDKARQRWPIEFSAALRGVLIRRTGIDIGRQ